MNGSRTRKAATDSTADDVFTAVATDTVVVATTTDSTADDTAATRCNRTPDMFEVFNEKEK